MSGPGSGDARTLYLDLMERCLTRSAFGPPFQLAGPPASTVRGALFRLIRKALPDELAIVRRATIESREEGGIWPADAETMIGLARLRNIRDCAVRAISEGIPGDLIETGVWRGGATIYMRAILMAYGITDRRVWVADSFRGLPPPKHPRDTTDWSRFTQLAVPAEDVRANFERYQLLDEQVRFLEGFFADTLPRAPIARLALLRLDGDMYESTMDALTALYDKVAPGGFVIVDDYAAVDACRSAVDDFRREHRITAAIERIDWSGVFWRA